VETRCVLVPAGMQYPGHDGCSSCAETCTMLKFKGMLKIFDTEEVENQDSSFSNRSELTHGPPTLQLHVLPAPPFEYLYAHWSITDWARDSFR